VAGAWLAQRSGLMRWTFRPAGPDPVTVELEALEGGAWRGLWLSGWCASLIGAQGSTHERRRDPPSPLAGEALARQAEGNASAALLAYRKYLSRVPDSDEAWSNLAALLRGLGRAEEARGAAQRALDLQPGSPHALTNLGNALGDLERWTEAEAAFREALLRDPEHPGARVNLGWCLPRGAPRRGPGGGRGGRAAPSGPARGAPQPRVHPAQAGRLPEAEAAFRTSLRLDPDRPLAHWNLAFVRLLQGKWSLAWPDYPGG